MSGERDNTKVQDNTVAENTEATNSALASEAVTDMSSPSDTKWWGNSGSNDQSSLPGLTLEDSSNEGTMSSIWGGPNGDQSCTPGMDAPDQGDKNKPETGDDAKEPKETHENKDGWDVTSVDGQPTEITRDGKTTEIPEGATDFKIENGVPSYTNAEGINVSLGENGEPIKYSSNGFSFEYHESDNAWYYHEDKGGDYVKIDVPTVNEDGSISTRENGGWNSGREHSLDANGQSTESIQHQLGDVITDTITKPLEINDAIWGTNTEHYADIFVKSFGDSFVDGTVNDLVYGVGLLQGGLEQIPGIPDLPQIDQAIPQLDVYEDFDPTNASVLESFAYRGGQLASYFVPGTGELKAGSKALNAVTKIADLVGEFGSKAGSVNTADENLDNGSWSGNDWLDVFLS